MGGEGTTLTSPFHHPQGSVVVEFDKKEGAHAALAAATQKYEDHEITVTAKYMNLIYIYNLAHDGESCPHWYL